MSSGDVSVKIDTDRDQLVLFTKYSDIGEWIIDGKDVDQFSADIQVAAFALEVARKNKARGRQP